MAADMDGSIQEKIKLICHYLSIQDQVLVLPNKVRLINNLLHSDLP